jgi:hypothetical protein
MARAVFLLLVLVNLVFFILAAGYLGGQDAGHEPERLAGQLQPERLKVTVVTESQAPAAVEKPIAGSRSANLLCRRVGPLAAGDAEKLSAAVVKGGGKAETVGIDSISYWVFIPAQGGKAPNKEIVALRQAGITEYFLVSDDDENRNAISLGLFHKEEAAGEFLQRLTRKGIKSAKVAKKPRKTDKVMVDIRGDTALLDRLMTGVVADTADCPPE